MPSPHEKNTLYSVYKTTAWFAVSSIVLLASLIVMVGQDYNREWKHWQRKFVEFEREKLEKDVENLKKSVDAKKLEELKESLRIAQSNFEKQKAQLVEQEKQKEFLLLEQTKAKTKYQDLKQFYDSYKYFYEEHAAHKEKKKADEYAKKILEIEPKLEQAKLEQEKVDKKIEDIEKAALKAEEKQKTAEKELSQLLKDQNLIERRLKQLEPSAAKEILNAPMLDFIAPSLQIQQVVLEDLHDDLYFAKAQKVDRCTTCHLAIDRKGFEDAPQPFKTHPNLDLFLGASSPHPLGKIGCTVCHGGSGQSLSFTYAAHTPQSEEQAKEWKKEHHWHELEKWEAKMLPLNHVEASCTKCHQGTIQIPEAPKLDAGRKLAMKAGCFGCHTVKGFSAEGGSASGGEGAWKAGPDLTNIKSKVTPDWIMKWLSNPKAFRPSTNMPSIFHLENTSSPEDIQKSNTAIWGIALYLIKNSGTVELIKAPKKTDPENGKKLVETLGCMGCHSLDKMQANDHGPELVGLGSKVSADWLYTWLKDPKHYSSSTRMPNLRLTNQEAADITGFLLQNRNEKFEKSQIPQISDESLDQFVKDYMSRKMRTEEAETEIAKMDKTAKFEYVGKEAISQQGCFGCHNIKGFENAKPIGIELTREGEKLIDRLDFGYVDIPRTRQDWFFQKLKRPRSFDHGRIREYHEKLRMPEFGFSDDEARSLTTFLLSLREEKIPLEMQKDLDLREEKIEKGRWLVSKFNCQGCHTLDGIEGRARKLFEDVGNAPPIIDGEGAKVQEKWLFEFLHAPTTIRPWLKYRMPTFGFSEEELDSLVKYFSSLDKQEVSYVPEKAGIAAPEELASGKELFVKLKCIQCHQGVTEGMASSFLAPDLSISKNRLKPDWVTHWIHDPQAIQPGTMMPTFFPDGTTPIPDILNGDAQKQIHAIRDYLWTFTPEEAADVKSKTGK